ncbi:MAG: hypothetical protein Ct9H300mP8_11980 [Gammaproteobacteria bacterium]|nr:MAG: hypothetical protein Ct9H300mP8_11980 [Gammaproteobacteria bacterium]
MKRNPKPLASQGGNPYLKRVYAVFPGVKAVGRGPRTLEKVAFPDAEPTHQVTYVTREDQALTTDFQATATRCIRILRSRPWVGSTNRFYTDFAPTDLRVERF